MKRIDGKPRGTIYSRATSSNKKMLYYKSVYLGYKQVSTGLTDTPRNRKLVAKKLEDIYLEHEFGIKQQSKHSITIFECFEKFKEERAKIGNTHANTIKNYTYAFKNIFPSDFEVNQSENRNFKEYFKIEAEIYSFVANTKLQANSVRIYLRGIRVFVNWLAGQGYISKIDINKYFPATIEKTPYAYSYEEVGMILTYFTSKRKTDIVNWLTFILNTGSRLTESLRLTWDLIDFENRLILFPKKNRRHILDKFPMNDTTFNLLIGLKSEAEKRRVNRDKVFKWNEGSMRYLSRILTEALVELGIKKEGVLFNSFRKYFITRLIEKDSNLMYIKKLARHADLKTTEDHYMDVDIDKLRSIISE